MLWQRMQTNCVHMVEADTADGIGGVTHDWTEGGAFRAAIVKDSTTQGAVAEKAGVTELYTITTAEALGFHDVLKRTADGAIFRVTSNSYDSAPPDEATFTFRQVKAERWVLA